MPADRIDCVGAIVLLGDRILLVRRGHEPAKGLWSVPGGRVEPGETDAAATAREVLEETALAVDVGPFVGEVERDAPGGSVFVIRDYRCDPAQDVDPEAVRAGDDAADVAWFTREDMSSLACSPGLVEALTAWRVWDRVHPDPLAPDRADGPGRPVAAEGTPE